MKASISIILATFSWLASANPVTKPTTTTAAKPATQTQVKAQWNLEAISHRYPPKTINFLRQNTGYLYNPWPADKTFYAYVLDSGIRTTHEEFGGRVENFWTAHKTGDDDNFDDDHGHGTHVAGILASKTYGVAKQARVLSVKVFGPDGHGKTSQAIMGFIAAMNDITSKNRQNNSVINYSGGRSYSVAWNLMVERAFLREDGPVLTVTSAGNTAIDAGDASPGCSDHVITVGSINSNWNLAADSNFGCKVNILAPGVQILSTSNKGDVATTTKSGTSMASAHVAALVLNAMAVFGKSSSEVLDFLVQTATKDRIKGDLRGSPNLLANNNNPKQRS